MSFEAIYRQSGNVIASAPSTAVSAGEVGVVSDNLVGVALEDIAADALGTLAITGVFDVSKEASLAISAGDKVYWDAANNEADTTDTNKYLGIAVADAAAADSTVRVKLDNPG